jgi:hypothetical protein
LIVRNLCFIINIYDIWVGVKIDKGGHWVTQEYYYSGIHAGGCQNVQLDKGRHLVDQNRSVWFLGLS